MFEIEVGDDGVITLAGRLDASQEDKATSALKTVDRSATLDFAGLDYISSAGIGVIIETYKRLHGGGHTLRLIHMNPRVRNVFAYAGLDKLLKIE
jgi:anti-sigma B factor antagonist